MRQATETLEKPSGLTPNEIRILIQARQEDIKEVGDAIAENPNRISDTISRNRKNQRIRTKLAQHLGLAYAKLWGEEVSCRRERARP